MDFAAAQPILHFDSFENVCALRTLAQNCESWRQCHNFRAGESNKQRKKTLIRSKRWRRPADFLEIAPRGELKELISLVLRDVNR